MIADSVCDIALCRTLTHQIAWEADAGMSPKLLHAKAAMVKLTASESAGRVIDRALQIFGGRGYMRENPVERLYRDIRVDRIWEGTSEIQRMIIANEVSKRGLEQLVSYRVAEPAVHA
jgi:butyryl-CoA dehydrogenase